MWARARFGCRPCSALRANTSAAPAHTREYSAPGNVSYVLYLAVEVFRVSVHDLPLSHLINLHQLSLDALKIRVSVSLNFKRAVHLASCQVAVHLVDVCLPLNQLQREAAPRACHRLQRAH
jgi:hypothetical protein